MKYEVATLGGGCFWCLEAVFEEVKGVVTVVSGYAGGTLAHPSYEDVCSGLSAHAEVVQITFDASIIDYTELLEVFWLIHDPTTLNRQGNDEGSQYRSVIFYHDTLQKQKAEVSMQKVRKDYEKPIVTELAPLPIFYEAEAYHQHYFKNHPNQGYCAFIISPKVKYFKQVFQERVK